MTDNAAGNILMVSNYPSTTAYAWWLMEHFWKTLAEQYATGGRTAYVAFPHVASVSETLKNAPLSIVELTLPWKTKEQKKAVFDFLSHHEITAIYFTDQPYLCWQYGLLRAAGINRIVVHDHTPGDRPSITGIKRLIKVLRNRLPWFAVDRVFCVSELMRLRSIQNACFPPHKCTVIQNGIVPVTCASDRRSIVRQDLGIESDTLLVISSGRAHPYKRMDFVIEVADLVRTYAPDLKIHFLIVGDGPAIEELRLKISDLFLETRVSLLGFRSDVRNLLCAADIAIHAALGEGFSLAITEYMSAGLSVLVPNIPSVMQAIDHNKTGLVYMWDQPRVAANYIIDLARSPQLRQKLSLAAKLKADQDYRLDRCTRVFAQAAAEAFALSNLDHPREKAATQLES